MRDSKIMAQRRRVAQQTAATTAPTIPVLIKARSRMPSSALGRGGIARVRSGCGERLHVRLSVIIGHHSRLVFVRHDRLGHPWHCFEAGFDGMRTRRAVYVLDCEGDGS